MICVSLPGPAFEDLKRQMNEAFDFADLFELRSDLYPDLNLIEKVFAKSSRPVMITCRRCDWIPRLARLKPAYMDLDYTIPESIRKLVPPEVKIIRSLHSDFPDVNRQIKTVTQHPADLYKIAVHSSSILDSFHLLDTIRSSPLPLTVVGMGEFGECTRICAPIFGSRMVYASPNSRDKTAPGQIPAETLVKTYHYRRLNSQTRLYGLIGDPVAQSIGHHFHNEYMIEDNALYLRLRVKREELKQFLPQALSLGFQGLSVTIPHKEAILPLLTRVDDKARAIGAVNTVTVEKGHLIGSNTDADGALDALETVMPVSGKTIVLLGAGGAARAIAYEAERRGARLIILNRHPEKAQRLCAEFGGTSGPMEDLRHFSYDIIINTTPHPCPVDPSWISPGCLGMEIAMTPEDTLFFKTVKEKGGDCIKGEAMFFRQAQGQKRTWYTLHANCTQGASPNTL